MVNLVHFLYATGISLYWPHMVLIINVPCNDYVLFIFIILLKFDEILQVNPYLCVCVSVCDDWLVGSLVGYFC